MEQAISEFSIPPKFKTNRLGPARWVFSHAMHQWPIVVVALFGAFSNAALASVGPIMVGLAFNAILASPPQVSKLLPYALILAGSQVLRGILQFGRNFGFELIAQRVERDVRDELYTSLLGKSMTFHSLQMVGETMARATNDVREVNFLFSPGVNMVVGSLNFLIVPLIVAPTYHPTLVHHGIAVPPGISLEALDFGSLLG